MSVAEDEQSKHIKHAMVLTMILADGFEGWSSEESHPRVLLIPKVEMAQK